MTEENDDHFGGDDDESDDDEEPKQNETETLTKRQRRRLAARRVKASLQALDGKGSNTETVATRNATAHDDCHQNLDGHHPDTKSINVFEYAEDDDEINHVMEEIEIEVANDSGSVAHVVGPDDVPANVEVVKPPDGLSLIHI